MDEAEPFMYGDDGDVLERPDLFYSAGEVPCLADFHCTARATVWGLIR